MTKKNPTQSRFVDQQIGVIEFKVFAQSARDRGSEKETEGEKITDIKLYGVRVISFVQLTLHNCCPVDSSSNGCREKHLEQANNITWALILNVFAVGSPSAFFKFVLFFFSNLLKSRAQTVSLFYNFDILLAFKISFVFCVFENWPTRKKKR